MPIYDFVENAEVDSDVTEAILTTTNGPVEVPIDKFKSSLLLFSENGKPVKEDGPVHLFFDDASNKDNPIKGISKITRSEEHTSELQSRGHLVCRLLLEKKKKKKKKHNA